MIVYFNIIYLLELILYILIKLAIRRIYILGPNFIRYI